MNILKTIVVVAFAFIVINPGSNTAYAQGNDINGTGRELIQYCNNANYQRSVKGDLNVGWVYCVGAVHGVVVGWKLGFTV